MPHLIYESLASMKAAKPHKHIIDKTNMISRDGAVEFQYLVLLHKSRPGLN
jgi:hypothetical protein